MNLKLLELFCCIVEEGSISGAARRNYLSQPSATKSIRYLEEEYGALLFNREKGSISLTEVGKTLYPHAKAIIHEYHNSREAVRYKNEKVQSQLKVGASFTLGEYFLPSVISDYIGNTQLEDAGTVQLFIENTPNILEKLDDKEIDVAFVEGEVVNNNLIKEAIAYDEVILIVGSTHPWSTVPHVLTNELKNEKLIAREKNSGTRKIIAEHLEKKGVLKDIFSYMELNTTQAIKSAVRSGLGYGFASYYSVKQEIDNGLLIKVPIADLTISRPLWCVKKPLNFEKPAIKIFSRMVKDSFVHN
ncbi:LysR family transcriptional regulator [Salicibibacter cibarius]|uniref:LysR family transcriptional regulator n=1 Tax=Salicibibacter cibarius TaxID=2743000 RepID=A0A7T6Z468_9BACI|nr:LysR family transcriptional regulator [Salicibibacter cibarius]QQK76584.1 LysR family transcriptional regulator [Salicibibacter cibarius]